MKWFLKVIIGNVESATSTNFLIGDLNKHFSLIIDKRNWGGLQLHLVSDLGTDDLEKKFDKLTLFFALYYPLIAMTKGYFSGEITDLQYDWMKITTYIDKNFTEQENLLSIALAELKNNDVFNTFPKLVNWLDDNEAKGISGFCAIRDGFSHGQLDPKRAFKVINEKFPSMFEFEGLILKRNKNNKQRLESYFPQLMVLIKSTFENKFLD